MHYRPDILIIGAGISGITCAKKCREYNLDYLLLEKSNRIGGRVGSIYKGGYIFDIGFQVFNTSYDFTRSLLDLDQLNLQFFKPGALIYDDEKFNIISDPMRDLGQIFNTLFSRVLTISDKLKILQLKYSLKNYLIENDITKDKDTLTFLVDYGFSKKLINNFFLPFFSGVFLEKKLRTSSKFFKYVFSKFSSGLACIPAKGMQDIPNNLLKKINNDTIKYESEVKEIITESEVKLTDGQIYRPKKIILTGDSQFLISKKDIKYNSVKTLYFCSDNKPINSEYIHIFPKEPYINNIAFLTSVSRQYSKNNDNLISVSVIESKISDLDLITHVKDRLVKIYGGNFNFLKYFDIAKATIYQPVNYFNQKSYKNNNIYFSGDYLVHGSIEGSVLSGIKVLDDIYKNFR